jgi:Tol biopolymer transport system component
MNGTGKQGDTTLLLTDGQQSHEAIQFGLWTLDLTNSPVATPQPLLASNTSQGPLALAPSGNVLLYSSYEGIVSVPTDGSVPTDIATLYYPNSLKVTTLDEQPLAFDTSQVILPEQHELSNSAAYHWVTTPVFTLDGHTLIYVEFSSQGQPPYDRSSAIFMAQISGSGKHLRVSQPQLMATVNIMLLELGVWFNDHVLTFYGDGILYALDIQSGAVATIAQTGVYARPIAVVGTGGV